MWQEYLCGKFSKWQENKRYCKETMWLSVCPLTNPHSAGLRPLLYYTLVGRILGENWKNTLAWPWGQRMDFLRITLRCFFLLPSLKWKKKSNAMWLCVDDLSTPKSHCVAFLSYFHNGSKIKKSNAMTRWGFVNDKVVVTDVFKN